jgi:hypothetical protein
MAKAKPGYDGNLEIATRLVPDPYEPGATIEVACNITDPLSRAFNSRLIDLAQFKAGQRFAALVERAGGHGGAAVDLSRPTVDGTRRYPALAASRLDAVKELAAATTVLGFQTDRLLRAVLVDGITPTSLALAKGLHKSHVAVEMRQGLERLAVFWGYLTRPEHVRKRAAMAAWMAERPAWDHDVKEVAIAYARPQRAAAGK